MTDQARVDAQLALEATSVEMGIARYREALAADGSGTLPPGQKLLIAAMKPMTEAVAKWLDKASKGLASRSAGVYHFINQLKPEALAFVTAQTTIGMLHQAPNITTVARAITSVVETTLTMDNIAAKEPRLAKKLAEKVVTYAQQSRKAVLIRKGADKAEVSSIQWDTMTEVRVGTLLLHLFAESTGLVVLEKTYAAGGKTPTVVRPSQTCRDWLEGAHARCELLSPVRMPMVCEPKDWTTPFNGGYLTKALRQKLVKSRNQGFQTELREWDMPHVYEAVNTLQKTEWSVNERVYDTARTLWEASSDIAGLPSRDVLPLPAQTWLPEETPEPSVLQAWKVEAAKTHEANAKMESKRIQTSQKLWTVEKMMEHGNGFFYVYSLDWRGRMYPIASSLSPQGDDLSKALLHFRHAEKLGETGAYWLAIHTANTFGVDKVSFDERIAWVEANEDMILNCAADPLVFREWADADSPFCFLAACFEWAHLCVWVNAGAREEDFESPLAVAFDGACNGLQNFSAMLLDPIGGKATGLIPSEKPSDIYTEVMRASQAIIDADAATGNEQALRWVGKLTRKHAKRNTMTVPYGVTKRGMRDQLYAEMDDVDSQFRGADAQYLAACNYEAIGSVVVAARLAMDWLKEAAKVAASTKLPVRWETPMGFLAVQDYRNDIGEEADFQVMGRRYRLILNREGEELNTRKQSLGISPNFIHSLDAAHLMRTVLFCKDDGITQFAMIHDSYGVHAGRASALRDNLRAAFVDQYKQPVLESFCGQLLEQLPPELHGDLPPLPPMGTLDLNEVLKSDYFFA